MLDANGWQQRIAMGSVFGRWPEIVGPDLAAHTWPDSYADGELAVVADSTAWATQVRLLAPMLVKRLNEEVGDGSVRRVRVRGPQPPKRRGGLRVPGSKGPGDTYGLPRHDTCRARGWLGNPLVPTRAATRPKQVVSAAKM